jgi:hypothetical protein
LGWTWHGLAQRLVIWTWNEFHLQSPFVGCFLVSGLLILTIDIHTSLIFLKLCTPSLSKVANHTTLLQKSKHLIHQLLWHSTTFKQSNLPNIPHTHSYYYFSLNIMRPEWTSTYQAHHVGWMDGWMDGGWETKFSLYFLFCS